jgi:hypothetical protein
VDRFIALPVKGDAFLYQRSGINILVDGGSYGPTLAQQLQEFAPHIKTLHIVVCTHADKDHAGGLTSFLDYWDGNVHQFWLPGRWADVIPDLMTNARSLIDSMIGQLHEFGATRPLLNGENIDFDELESSIENEASAAPRPERHQNNSANEEEEDINYNDLERLREPEWMKHLREKAREIVQYDEEAQRVFRSAKGRVYYRIRRGAVGRSLGKYWLELIDTADRIRKIANSAIEHHVSTRWFDYSDFADGSMASGGVRGLLTPVNAVEQVEMPKMREVWFFARLTQVNIQSLVFYAPENKRSLGALFNGDSPLGTGPGYARAFPFPGPPPRKVILATAPHHGADSNQMAYGHVSNWAGLVLWVRSGGSSRHPGASFRSLLHRACTNCPHLSLPLRSVDISINSTPIIEGWIVGEWWAIRNYRACSC